MSEAAAYLVWRVDCYTCGTVIDYGEDESSLPDECENCGEPVEIHDAH